MGRVPALRERGQIWRATGNPMLESSLNEISGCHVAESGPLSLLVANTANTHESARSDIFAQSEKRVALSWQSAYAGLYLNNKYIIKCSFH